MRQPIKTDQQIRETIGEKIKNIRKEGKITQMQLAEVLHIDYRTMSAIELGNRKLDLAMVLLIADVLEVPLTDLIDHPAFLSPTEAVIELQDEVKELKEFIYNIQNQFLKMEQGKNYRP